MGWIDTTSKGHRVVGYRGRAIGAFRVGAGMRANWTVGRRGLMLTLGLPFEWPRWQQGRIACGLVSLRFGPTA